MNPNIVLKRFARTMATWESALEGYDAEELRARPDGNGWSIGHVDMHLVNNALHYNVPQIKACLSSNRNRNRLKTRAGEAFFARNGFPNERLKGPPSDTGPERVRSADQIRKALRRVHDTMAMLGRQIAESPYRGKTRHPGLGWLYAEEWLRFVDMHTRHHLRQKARTDRFLRERRRQGRAFRRRDSRRRSVRRSREA